MCWYMCVCVYVLKGLVSQHDASFIHSLVFMFLGLYETIHALTNAFSCKCLCAGSCFCTPIIIHWHLFDTKHVCTTISTLMLLSMFQE